jgi:hypothetical protein
LLHLGQVNQSVRVLTQGNANLTGRLWRLPQAHASIVQPALQCFPEARQLLAIGRGQVFDRECCGAWPGQRINAGGKILYRVWSALCGAGKRKTQRS